MTWNILDNTAKQKGRNNSKEEMTVQKPEKNEEGRPTEAWLKIFQENKCEVLG